MLQALSRDPIMRGLRDRFGDVCLKQRAPFSVLSRSIIAQQISAKAAETIRERLAQRYETNPSLIAQSGLTALRSLGLSESKARCLLEVADIALRGELDSLEASADEEIRDRLLQISGIGPWTVDMFMIFCLARPDVWPTSDGGLRAAARQLYGVTVQSDLLALGDRFRPHRSYAAIYLWQSLENTHSKRPNRGS
jgi:DNA-3-methyladenine glycosylase II